MTNSQPTSDEPQEHRINPATDRCVTCGRNAFNRKNTPYCDYKRPSEPTSNEREERFYWFNERPTVNGFYWLRGWRHYADLPISIDGDSFWMMFGLARNHRTDLDDSEDVQFLGPVTPYTATIAATAIRDTCVVHLRTTADALDVRQETECPSGTAFNSEATLRRRIATELQSLTLDQVQENQ